MCKSFGATRALEGVNLSVSAGEVLALVGENGAGKSTLMKILAGAVRPDEGQMLLDGVEFRPGGPLDARRAGVAMIYQELSLAPHLSVEDNIMLGIEPQVLGWLRRKEIRRRAEDALRWFSHVDIRPGVAVRRLSVAAQQLVEIARALVAGCRVLVLDEPTSSLSGEDTRRLFALVGDLRSRGIAVIYISHFLEEVKAVSDRVTVLRDGRTVGEGETRALAVDEMVRMMVGREVKDLYPRSARKAGEVALRVTNLAGVIAPVEATLELRRGEVLGIAGLMGAGRTELLRCIFGLDRVRRGEVRVGVHAGLASPVRRWCEGVGMLSEDRKREGLALGMDIADNLTLPKLGVVGWRWFVSPGKQAAVTRSWIARLGIRCTGPRQKVGALSGGNQQKVALARLLHGGVDVLLLDEPTRGIDVAAKATLYQLISELAEAGRPAAILVVSSYLPELLGICDRVAVMCRGRLGEPRPVMQVSEHTLMLEATGQGGGRGVGEEGGRAYA